MISLLFVRQANNTYQPHFISLFQFHHLPIPFALYNKKGKKK